MQCTKLNPRSIAVFLSVAALCGCSEEAGLSVTAEHYVYALWDPTTSTLPTPTDLVRNGEAEQLALPIDASLSGAEVEVYEFLNRLDGYPLSTPLSLPLSGPVHAATVARALRVVDLETGALVSVASDFDEARNQITAHATAEPAGSVTPGHSYVFGLAGYAQGVVGTTGDTVVADAAFSFVRSRKSLLAHEDAMPGGSRHERHEAAAALEEIRLDYQPYFAAMDALGWPREELAVVGGFTVTNRPAVWFDPLSERIPTPNNLLLNRRTGRVELPVSDADSDYTAGVKRGLSTYDGFSTAAALVVTTTETVDRASAVAPGALRVFRVDDGSFAEVEDLNRGLVVDGHGFWVKPHLPLAHSARYALVATRQVVGSSGAPLEAQTLAAVLMAQSTLVDPSGRSTVSVLNDEQAASVEPVRAELAPLLNHLEANGLPREQISAAVTFDTTTAPEQLFALRDEVYQREVPTGVTGLVVATPAERGMSLVLPRVETIISGQMTTLDHLDPYTRAWRERGPLTAEIDFVLTLPKGYDPGERIPVVLFGQGHGTSRELVYLVADRLASGGYAAFAIDFPYHGKRSICLADGDCTGGAHCEADGRCINSDGSPGQIATIDISLFWPEGPTYPLTTGAAYIDAADPFASRDHIFQTMVDLYQSVRVIDAVDWGAIHGGYDLGGPGDVVYLGISLGGIVGALMSATEPTISSYALNVPGGNFVTLMEDSSVFGPGLDDTMADLGITEGSAEYFEFENTATWILDPVDPINVIQHAILDPLDFVDPLDGQTKTQPTKRVIIQMASGDFVVPNVCTQLLAEQAGVEVQVYTPLISNHGFLMDPTSLEGAEARDQVVEFFDAR